MKIEEIAYKLAADGKGILAADESTATILKRFETINTESTAESRRDYRHLLFSSSAMKDYISGVILYDETLRPRKRLLQLIWAASSWTCFLWLLKPCIPRIILICYKHSSEQLEAVPVDLSFHICQGVPPLCWKISTVS